MPPVKGTYALVLGIDKDFSIVVGKKGTYSGPAGHYIYVGSAFGPGGLKARLGHHMKPAKKPHWHIDYLKRIGIIIEVWTTDDSERREHDWTNVLIKSMKGEIRLPGFGSSDCGCLSHLVYFKKRPTIHLFRRRINPMFANHAPIRQYPRH